MTREDCLAQARACVTGERARDYGAPEHNFERVARLWEVRFGHPITASDVAWCLAALKLARLVQSPGHADSWVDLAGYAACGAECSTTPVKDSP